MNAPDITYDEPDIYWSFPDGYSTLMVERTTEFSGSTPVWTGASVIWNGPYPAEYQASAGAGSGEKTALRATSDGGANWAATEAFYGFGVYGLAKLSDSPAGVAVKAYSRGAAAVIFQISEDQDFSNIDATGSDYPDVETYQVDFIQSSLKELYPYFVRAYIADYGGFTEPISVTTGNTIYNVTVSSIGQASFTLNWLCADNTYYNIVDVSDDGGTTWTRAFGDEVTADTPISEVISATANSQIKYRVTDDNVGDPQADIRWVEGTVELDGIRTLQLIFVGQELGGLGEVKVRLNVYPLSGEVFTLKVDKSTTPGFDVGTVTSLHNAQHSSGGVIDIAATGLTAGQLIYYRASTDNFTHSKSDSYRTPGIYDFTITPSYTSVDLAFRVSPTNKAITLERSVNGGTSWTTIYTGTPAAGYYVGTDSGVPQGTNISYRIAIADVVGYYTANTTTLGLSWSASPEWNSKAARLKATVTSVPGLVAGTPVLAAAPGTPNSLITVANSYYANLHSGDSVRIVGSTGNDGTYTITGGISQNNPNCDFSIIGTLPSSVADGYLQVLTGNKTVVVEVADNDEFSGATQIYSEGPISLPATINWDGGTAGEVYYIRAKSGSVWDERSQRLPGAYGASAVAINGTTVRVTFDLQPASTDGTTLSCKLIRSLNSDMSSPTTVFDNDLSANQTHVTIDDNGGGGGLSNSTPYYYRIWPKKNDEDYPYLDTAANTADQVAPLEGVAATQGTSSESVTITYTDPNNIDTVDCYESEDETFSHAWRVAQDQAAGSDIVIQDVASGQRRFFWLIAKASDKMDSEPAGPVMGWRSVVLTEYVLKTAVVAASNVKLGVLRWTPDGDAGTYAANEVITVTDNTIRAKLTRSIPGEVASGLNDLRPGEIAKSVNVNGALTVLGQFIYNEEEAVQHQHIETVVYDIRRYDKVQRIKRAVTGHVNVSLTPSSVFRELIADDRIAGSPLVNFVHSLGEETSPFTEQTGIYYLTYTITPYSGLPVIVRFKLTAV